MRLGSHVRESHGMTIDEYKERFDYVIVQELQNKNYSNIMRKHAKRKMEWCNRF